MSIIKSRFSINCINLFFSFCFFWFGLFFVFLIIFLVINFFFPPVEALKLDIQKLKREKQELQTQSTVSHRCTIIFIKYLILWLWHFLDIFVWSDIQDTKPRWKGTFYLLVCRSMYGDEIKKDKVSRDSK